MRASSKEKFLRIGALTGIAGLIGGAIRYAMRNEPYDAVAFGILAVLVALLLGRHLKYLTIKRSTIAFLGLAVPFIFFLGGDLIMGFLGLLAFGWDAVREHRAESNRAKA